MWALTFDLFVQCLVGLICVPDSPSSVVNKQLGSMTLDEQQGASFPSPTPFPDPHPATRFVFPAFCLNHFPSSCLTPLFVLHRFHVFVFSVSTALLFNILLSRCGCVWLLLLLWPKDLIQLFKKLELWVM